MDRRIPSTEGDAEEVPHYPAEALGLVEIREMSGVLEDDEAGIRNQLLHPPGMCDRSRVVIATPHEQSRSGHPRQQRGEVLVDNIDERRTHHPSVAIVGGGDTTINAVPQNATRSSETATGEARTPRCHPPGASG